MGNLNRELKVQNLKKSSVQSVTCPLWATIYMKASILQKIIEIKTELSS